LEWASLCSVCYRLYCWAEESIFCSATLGAFDGSRRGTTLQRADRSIQRAAGAAAPEVFRLAKRYAGVLTVSDVVSEPGIDPTEAEELLERLTDGRRVDMQVDSDGVVRYVFREFTS